MERMVVNVSVGTLWTSPDSPRRLDQPILTNPVDLETWLSTMSYNERLALCDDNLVQSQALYGTAVEVLEKKEGWAKVWIPDQPSSKDPRGYPGWMPLEQLQKVSGNENTGTVAVVNQPKAFLYDSSLAKALEVSFQTRLPLEKEDEEWVDVKTPFGTGRLKQKDIVLEHPQDHPSGSGTDIVRAGEQFLGLPYLWGGMSSFGYDCSGFAHMMHRSAGLVIPRDASDQAKSGTAIEREDLEPGDLLFFAYEKGQGYVHHVAIYYGDGQMIHAPKTGKTVEIITLRGTDYETEYWGARRYWPF